jgi:hypothetical protein
MARTAMVRQEAQGLAAPTDHRDAGVVAHGADGAGEVWAQQRTAERRFGRGHVAPRPQFVSRQVSRVKGFNVQHRHVS